MLSLENDIIIHTKRAMANYPKGVYLACAPLTLHESKIIKYFITQLSDFEVYKFHDGLVDVVFMLRYKGID